MLRCRNHSNFLFCSLKQESARALRTLRFDGHGFATRGTVENEILHKRIFGEGSRTVVPGEVFALRYEIGVFRLVIGRTFLEPTLRPLLAAEAHVQLAVAHTAFKHA